MKLTKEKVKRILKGRKEYEEFEKFLLEIIKEIVCWRLVGMRPCDNITVLENDIVKVSYYEIRYGGNFYETIEFPLHILYAEKPLLAAKEFSHIFNKKRIEQTEKKAAEKKAQRCLKEKQQ